MYYLLGWDWKYGLKAWSKVPNKYLSKLGNRGFPQTQSVEPLLTWFLPSMGLKSFSMQQLFWVMTTILGCGTRFRPRQLFGATTIWVKAPVLSHDNNLDRDNHLGLTTSWVTTTVLVATVFWVATVAFLGLESDHCRNLFLGRVHFYTTSFFYRNLVIIATPRGESYPRRIREPWFGIITETFLHFIELQYCYIFSSFVSPSNFVFVEKWEKTKIEKLSYFL